MKYEEEFINITDKFCENKTMYSLILLDAKSLTITLSGYRCFLDGKYIVCLNSGDVLSVHSGYYKVKNLSFAPYFYNINLNHEIIGMIFYDEMRDKYGYPDFRFFRMRDNNYFGIIHISDEEYNTADIYFDKAKRDIDTHVEDVMWSCRARSDIISILHIVEGAYSGKQSGLENEILRYVYDNIDTEISLDSLCLRFNTNRTTVSKLIKEKTGLPPMKYVLETRLNQSRPDLLFTKLPINEISEKYGFSDVNYYIRAFKKRFGKSPLQFRKDGWEARLRDEGIYHRRAEMEKTEMSVDEFCDFYEKGLGRAIIRLKKQADKDPYKKAFMEFLFGEKRQMHRALGVYEKEILDIFDDKAYTDEIANRLMNEIRSKDGHLYGPVSLLLLLGYRSQLEEILECRYGESYKELLEYTKKPWDGEKYPPFARVYMSICSALARQIKIGDERVKQMLFDIAELYNYCEYPVIPTYQNPLYGILDGVGSDHFFVILDEVIKEHKNGKCIDIRKNFLSVRIENEPMLAPTAEDILAYDELVSETHKYLEGFRYASKETVLEIAKAIVDEKTDIAKRVYLLNYFTFRCAPEESPVEFPLSPKPLIEMAEAENFELQSEPPFGVTWSVFEILENMRHHDIHKLAMKLFFDNTRVYENEKCARYFRNFVIGMRFGRNYIPETDKSDFVALLRSQDRFERNTAISVFIKNLSNGVEGLPLDLIPYIFANITQITHREDFCKTLVKSNLMSDEIREECLFDSEPRIRELVLKTQKPKKKMTSHFLSPPEMPR